VDAVAFAPNGRTIVSGAAYTDNIVRTWDAFTGQIKGRWRGHKDGIEAIAYTPDGKVVASGSQDGTVRLWDAATGQQIGAPLGNDAPVAQARFSPDGARVVAATGDKTARLWDLKADNRNLVSQARAIVPRCLTPAQRKAVYLPPEPPAWCIEMVKWPYDTPEWKRWLVNKRAGKNPPLPVAP